MSAYRQWKREMDERSVVGHIEPRRPRLPKASEINWPFVALIFVWGPVFLWWMLFR